MSFWTSSQGSKVTSQGAHFTLLSRQLCSHTPAENSPSVSAALDWTNQTRWFKCSTMIFGGKQLIFCPWLSHMHLPITVVRTNIQYNIVLSSRISMFAAIQYPSLPWPGSSLLLLLFYIYIICICINTTLPSSGRIQCFTLHTVCKHTAKTSCSARQPPPPLTAGWFSSVQHARKNVHKIKSL